MLKKLILAAVLCLTISGCAKSTLRLGTAGEGGVYQRFGDSFASVIDSEKIRVDRTAGSEANLRLLSQDYIQLGLSQADIAEYMYREDMVRGYSAVAQLYIEAVQIAVRKDAGIESIEDLEGKRVSVGEKQSGTEKNAQQILSVYGVDMTFIEEEYLNYEDAAKEMQKGEIDAMFVTAGIGAQFMQDIAKDTEVEFLTIDDHHLDRLLRLYPFYQKISIPADTYNGMEKSVYTVGVPSILFVNNDLSEKRVYEITKTLYESQSVIDEHLSISLNLQPIPEGLSIPYHAGAEKYYAEKGVSLE